MSEPLAPEAAWVRLEALPGLLEPLAPLDVPRREALGRVLAQPLTATVDVPPLDVSAMDGYAVGGDPAPGDTLAVGGRIAAGDPPGARLPAGGALRIMTGAPLPHGADRVVPIELTDGGRQRVQLAGSVAAGAHVRRGGEIVHRGEPLLDAGAVLGPAALALLATHGFAELPVHRPPQVAVLTTGDEVVAPEVTPRPGQLRDSHTDFLCGALRGLRLEPRLLGIAPDDASVLRQRIATGLESDVLLLGGGVSAGELDLVEGVLAELGVAVLVDSVAIQPGKPLVIGHRGRTLVFGLPGNPGSVMAGFWLFVRPALRRLMGHADGFWQHSFTARTATALPAGGRRDRFLPALLGAGTPPLATPCAPRGSHDLMAFARGDALLRVRALAAPTAAGGECEVLALG